MVTGRLSLTHSTPRYLDFATATAGTENTLQTILRHKLPVDGEFILRVEELLRRGGPRFAYRIDALAGSGEFNLKLKSGKNAADRFWAIAGQQVEMSVQVDRKGYDGPINLTVANGWAVSGAFLRLSLDFYKLPWAIISNVSSNVSESSIYFQRSFGEASVECD